MGRWADTSTEQLVHLVVIGSHSVARSLRPTEPVTVEQVQSAQEVAELVEELASRVV